MTTRTCEDQQVRYLASERAAQAHVQSCAVCQAMVEELDGIREALGDALFWVEPDPTLEDRVVAALLIGALVGGVVSQTLGGGRRIDAHLALAGTELAPRARAEADLREDRSGIEIRLDVSGLPRAPARFYYQAWVKGASGLVPIGTFHTGNGTVVLWSGVPLDRYDTITVTIEEEGGDAASSGRRVLIGQLKRKR